AIRFIMGRNFFWKKRSACVSVCNMAANVLPMEYSMHVRSADSPIIESNFLKKNASFSKKIWQQVKAGYLCAPLSKKALALKKINDDSGIEKRKKDLVI